MVHQWPHKWSNYLPWVELCYNTTYHASTGMTPFQALYGRLPPPIPIYQNGFSSVHEVDQSLEARDELLRQLKSNLEASINRTKQIADQKRRDVSFEVGDLVFLKLCPYRQQTAFKRAHQKLASRFYGQYLVIQKIGAVAYKLHLPEGARIHPVFHVSLLKNYVGELVTPSKELPPVNDEGAVILEPKKILDIIGSNGGIGLKKKVWFNGSIYQSRTPRGRPTSLCLNDSLLWTLGTSVHFMGWVLIGHDDLREAISQILNIWDELGCAGPLHVACDVEGGWNPCRNGLGRGRSTCRRKWSSVVASFTQRIRSCEFYVILFKFVIILFYALFYVC